MPAHNGTGKFFDMVQDSLNGEKEISERVIASGDRLTIETIEDFARQIREGLAEASTVVIEFADEVELDITALQVFCSACRTATALNKRFIHRGPLPQSLPSLAAAAGSERFEQCKSSSMSCFRQFGGMK